MREHNCVVCGHAIHFRFDFPLQPLGELFDVLHRTKQAVNMEVSETWTRQYQVLPSRTHPTMNTNGASGYILSGVKVAQQGNSTTAPKQPTQQQQQQQQQPAQTTTTVSDATADSSDSHTAKKQKTAN